MQHAGAAADVVLTTGKHPEADLLGLAPSTSTTVMIALGDALSLVVSRIKEFTSNQFADFHPGGSLGNKLKRVSDVMRQGEDMRIASGSRSIRNILIELNRPGRRTGAIMIVDEDGMLTGLFTDSDLARLLEQRHEQNLDQPIEHSMTKSPLTVTPEMFVTEAIQLLSTHKFSELPVVESGHPVGLLDITDMIGLLPATR